jgi:ADP-ribose pyrophosphatase YjhB (NUDIX family)
MGSRTGIRDGQELQIQTNGQKWIIAWRPPPKAPAGQAHGAAGVCITSNSEIVLVSSDGTTWDLPAGRPEGDETWEQTLRREMREEACATVVNTRLLGFCRSHCIEGTEAGLVLVRSFWRAQVVLDTWEPAFEIGYRRVMPVADGLAHLPPVFEPVWRRALVEAAVL